MPTPRVYTVYTPLYIVPWKTGVFARSCVHFSFSLSLSRLFALYDIQSPRLLASSSSHARTHEPLLSVNCHAPLITQRRACEWKPVRVSTLVPDANETRGPPRVVVVVVVVSSRPLYPTDERTILSLPSSPFLVTSFSFFLSRLIASLGGRGRRAIHFVRRRNCDRALVN